MELNGILSIEAWVFPSIVATIKRYEQCLHVETSDTHPTETLGTSWTDQPSDRHPRDRGFVDLAFGLLYRVWADRLFADPIWFG